MSFARIIRVVAAVSFGVAGLFFGAWPCLGFGGVSVAVGGVSVGVGAPGVAIGAGVAPGGSGGVGASTGLSVGGGSVGASGGAAIGSGGAAAGASTSAGGGADVSGSGTTASLSTTDSVSGTTDGAALAAQRAALQMGVGPFQPDRGMAQALGYTAAAAAAVAASADAALSSAVNGLPALPSVTAAVDATARVSVSVSSNAASSTGADHPSTSTDQDQSDEAPVRSRHSDPPPQRRAALAADAPPAMPQAARAPSVVKRPDQTVVRRPDQRMPEAPARSRDGTGAIQQAAPVLVVNPGDSLLTSIAVAPEPPAIRPAGQHIQNWTISGSFSDIPNPSLPTAAAMAIVMMLSAASAYGFVRATSRRCPGCSALLERHSAGCRNCGTRLQHAKHSDLRWSS
jgi:hypothetical protein